MERAGTGIVAHVVAGIAQCEAAPPTGLAVAGDGVRVTQVLVNLLSNAIKYNHDGGWVRLRVLEASRGKIGIEVADNGIGMTEEQVAHLFEVFNRLGRERSPVDGTGIGLALAKQLLGLMGGEIGVRSTHCSGSVFTIWLRQIPR